MSGVKGGVDPSLRSRKLNDDTSGLNSQENRDEPRDRRRGME